MSGDDTVPALLSVADGIARITLNRPENGNALNMAMAEALLDHATTCDHDDAIRVVILEAAGKLFCGGGDLAEMTGGGARPGGAVGKLASTAHLAMSRLARMPKPLICAIDGAAAGVGFGLALLGDIVVASERAKFVPAYPAIGMTLDGGISWLLPRLVGLRKAQEILLLNSRIDAAEALELGMVTRVVSPDALEETVAGYAATLADAPRRAVGDVRGLLAQSFGNGFETQLELEARSMANAANRSEGQEGFAAAREKRSPDFRD